MLIALFYRFFILFKSKKFHILFLEGTVVALFENEQKNKSFQCSINSLKRKVKLLLNIYKMDFGTVPTKKMCHICRSWIDVFDEKVQVEKHTMHKSCFVCAICDCPLKPGSCSRDDGMIYRQFMAGSRVPLWFCAGHMKLGSGEKCQLLREKYANCSE